MKKKTTTWNIVCIIGIPHFIILLFSSAYLKWELFRAPPASFGGTTIKIMLEYFKVPVVFAFFAWTLIVLKNVMLLQEGESIGLFTFMKKYTYNPDAHTSRKCQAQYPEVPAEFLSDEPDGLVVGKYKNKYVRIQMRTGNILNSIILGAPGCGKSALLLSMLIHYNNPLAFANKDFEPITFYVNDVKPELAIKSTIIKGNPNVHVLTPCDRSGYGWNPFYALSPETSDDDVFSELDVIARALISTKSEKNEFFYQSGRIIFKAIMFYRFREGDSFIQAMLYLMTGSLHDVIDNTLKAIENRPEYSIVMRQLSAYKGKDSEAFSGIEMSVRENLDIFNQQRIQWFLDYNPRKASPLDLENKISVFFSIHENIATEYQALMRLVTAQITKYCNTRPEGRHTIALIVDEAAKIARSVDWCDFMATSRSRNTVTCLAFQSMNQLREIWGENDAKSLFELCRIQVIFSCADEASAKMFSAWAGTYKEEKRSTTNGGKNNGQYSVSYEEKKILEHTDIMELQEKGEAVIFIRGKYYRCNATDARYYKNKRLARISEECVKANTNPKEE